MAAGMWEGLLAGYKDVEAKKMAREEKEEEILRRRRSVAATLRPKIQAQQTAVQNQRAMIDHLRNRGLADQTLNALLETPEMLEGAYSFATQDRGVDMSSEQLNEVYRASIIGGTGPADASQFLATLESTLGAFDTVEDPEVFMENLPAFTPSRTSAIEVRIPEKEKDPRDGVDPNVNQAWKLQQEVYDGQVLAQAQAERELLQSRRDAGEATDQDLIRITDLERDFASYESNLGSKIRLRTAYDAAAKEFMAKNMAEDAMFRLEENPFLSLNPETLQQTATEPEAVPVAPSVAVPEGGVLVGQGVDPADGLMTYFYRMLDGTVVPVKE